MTQTDSSQVRDKLVLKGGGKKRLDFPSVKKGTTDNGSTSQQKEDKRPHPRSLQEMFERDSDPSCSSRHLTAEDRESFSSKTFLNFKFDRDAIMKCFDY
ncbi:PREDICTED: m7GpppN-mRNA hydrolase isoform X2 [Cyprinodon variegatus]|uniref:m7GpppN-mRNA hydrolase isoform X2 n=1 Tax=Cyprinodon variegatus TaxID=28743 RepID=UPI0007425C30|nr:PREDICTED: m7GpppN-mRNA hydrolase isoform X2 [Cyprinodon variegatus]